MLTLPFQTVGPLLLVTDDDPGRPRVAALTRPRVARGIDGRSRLQLARWTTTNGATPPLVGGRLNLDLEIAPTAVELRAAGLDPEHVTPMPWIDASVRLEGPQLNAVATEVSAVIGTDTSVAVELSPETAAILAPLLDVRDAVSPLQVVWTGHIWVRLPPVEVFATANVEEVRRRTEIVAGNIQRIIIRSIIDANAHIEIRGSTNAAIEAALRDWILEELTTKFTQGDTLTLHAAASEVVKWPVTLAATLEGLEPGPRGSFVETILLDDTDVGRVPAIDVRAFGDFDSALERVDVRLEALAGGRADQVACTSRAPVRAALGTLDFRWSSRAALKNRPSGNWSEWQKERQRTHLIVTVPTPPSLTIEVLGGALDFTNRWASVVVSLSHQGDGGSAAATGRVELTPTQTTGRWSQALDGPRGRVAADLEFVSRQGTVVAQHVVVTGDQLVLADPLDTHRVRAVLVPAGTGWPDVAIAMIDLRYTDGAYAVDETVELHKLEDLVQWEAPARPDGPATISWRLHTSFKDGRFESGSWQSAPPGVIVIRVDGVPRREVQILPVFFDAAVTAKGTLTIRSSAGPSTIAVTDRAKRTIVLPPGPFTWTLAWTEAGGRELPALPEQPGEDVIVVPRFERR